MVEQETNDRLIGMPAEEGLGGGFKRFLAAAVCEHGAGHRARRSVTTRSSEIRAAAFWCAVWSLDARVRLEKVLLMTRAYIAASPRY
jgi:hypothetical protein